MMLPWNQRGAFFCDVFLRPSQRNLPTSRTEEHVFAKWYRSAVVNNKIKMYTATMGSPPVLHRQPPLERLVNTAVCGECKCGWMSRLETNVAPIVQRIVAGNELREFSDAEIELLARWAGKTAAVLSHVTPQLARVPKLASLSPSTVCLRSSPRPSPDRVSLCRFRNAHHLSHWAEAASGGLNPGPATWVRRTRLHLSCSTAAFRLPHYITASFPRLRGAQSSA